MKTPEIRARELFKLFHGPGDGGSESEFLCQNPAGKEAWIRLGKLVLDLEKKWTRGKHHIAAVQEIAKICKSRRHKDPMSDAISDILCECNRAERLTTESLSQQIAVRTIADEIEDYKNTPKSVRRLMDTLVKAIIDSGIKVEIKC